MKYTTVVYEFKDDAAFAEEWQRIRPMFLAEKPAPLRITGVAADDQMTRLDLVRELVERDALGNIDLIRELIDAPDLDAWRAENFAAFTD